MIKSVLLMHEWKVIRVTIKKFRNSPQYSQELNNKKVILQVIGAKMGYSIILVDTTG